MGLQACITQVHSLGKEIGTREVGLVDKVIVSNSTGVECNYLARELQIPADFQTLKMKALE